jgi:rRNA maturation endonuclease Nob1
MINKFKTVGEAWRICEKYGLHNITAAHSFQIAEALLRAYRDGAKEHTDTSDMKKPCQVCEGMYTTNPHTFCNYCGRDISCR